MNPSHEADVDLDALFEVSLDCLAIAGFDGYLKRVSRSWTRILGWTEAELLSKPSIEFVHPDDRAATLAARGRIKDGAPLAGLINRYCCLDGSYRWFDWRSVSYLDRQRIFAVARDITDARRAEQEHARLQVQLAVSERMASLGRLAAGVAHEINNPLAFMIANLGTLRRELPAHGPSDGEFEAMLSETLEGAERVRKIVHGLQTFSRPGRKNLRPVDVRAVLKLCLELMGGELQRRARVREDYREAPLVYADEARLGEAFLSLLTNAAQAVEGRDQAEIRIVTAGDDQGRAVVEIADNGPGIPPDALGRIFDPFFTNRPVGSGAGLGLSISHNVVSELGGEIAVHSEPGQGAVFRVSLPPMER